MASLSTVPRSLSVGSLDGWTDAAPTGRCGRKPSIDSMSSWCLADVHDPEDWIAEQGMSDVASPVPLPAGLVTLHTVNSSDNRSRRSSLESWDESALIFERDEDSDASWTRVRAKDLSNRARSDSFSSVATDDNSSDIEGEDHSMRRKHSICSVSSRLSEADSDFMRVNGEELIQRRGSIESIQSFSSAEHAWGPSQRESRHNSVSVEGEWACVRCSFLNHSLLPTCEMCEAPRDYQEPVDQPALRLHPSFADVVRSPPRAISVVQRRNVRPRGGTGQKPVLRVPRVRPTAGLALMAKCNRTLSSFCSSSGSEARRPHFPRKVFSSLPPSTPSRPQRSGCHKYYLPEIEGIPEEEEEAKCYGMQDPRSEAEQEQSASSDDEILEACARSLAVSVVDDDEIPLSELFAEEEPRICEPISP